MSSSGSSEPEEDDEVSDTLSIIPRSLRGVRSKATRDLRSSLPQKSVETYTEFLHRQNQPIAEEESFNTTQDGIVIWTPQEKWTLYQTLDKKGKNGVRDIATAVRTKSELEVQEYLRLLQKGVRKYHFNDRHARTAILGEIPAAAEISEECCEALDKYAELLGLEEQRVENAAGKNKHKGLWIINKEAAENLEADITGNENQSDLSVINRPNLPSDAQDGKIEPSPHDAAAFFNVTNCILLSERFFMNFGGPRFADNWVNVAFKDETPSMTADALTDIYEIALSVTRRLVEATHFFASSRVRRNGKRSRPSARVVKSSDVRGAARVLNMKSDGSEFWVGLARRCSLDVADMRHTKGWTDVRLNHDEVEALLSQKSLPKEPYKRNSPSLNPRERSNNATSEMSLTSFDGESSAAEDEHAEAVDQQNNSLDELLCWTVLGHSPPESIKAQISDKQFPSRPTAKRKTVEELVDWRERTLYQSEWEEYGYQTENLERAFKSQRKKRRLMISESGTIRQPSKSKIRDIASSESEEQPEAELKSESENSDPEFKPQSPQRKSKSVVSRTSARKRMSISYAPPPILDLDMEIDIDTEPEHDDLPDLKTLHQENEVNFEQKAEAGDYDDARREGAPSGSEGHIPSPRGGNLSSSDEDYNDDDD
ncbi:hypothetical protein BDW59DRAFT_146339 [Aspergillus cavernicola]|uniref:Myb-like domain-containing protein n=1 Tax=Aspergillus cavernicola TaxID=176166 RepID=A0ABR4IC17_9EURO